MPDAYLSLYLDEDVSVVLGAILSARGYNVLTVRDAKQLGQTDIKQLHIATEGNRILLTHNRVDFEQLPVELAARIGRLFTRLPPEDFANQLFYI